MATKFRRTFCFKVIAIFFEFITNHHLYFLIDLKSPFLLSFVLQTSFTDSPSKHHLKCISQVVMRIHTFCL